MTAKLLRPALPLAPGFLALAAYEVFVHATAALGLQSTRAIVMPPPSRVLSALPGTLLDIDFLPAMLHTVLVTLVGIVMGVVGAVTLGLLLGRDGLLHRALSPTLDFFRSLPVVLYVPVALVALGSDYRVPLFLSAIVTTLYGALPVTRSVRAFDREKILFLQARGRSRSRILVEFLLPDVLIELGTSLSIITTLALAVTVVADMLFPSLGGLGALLIHAREQSDYPSLWAATIVVGLTGFGLNKLTHRVWRMALAGDPGDRYEQF